MGYSHCISPSRSSLGALTRPQIQLYFLGAHLGGGGAPRALAAEGSVLQDGDAADGELDVVLPAAVLQEVGKQVTARGRLRQDLQGRDTVRSQLPLGLCWEEEERAPFSLESPHFITPNARLG